MGQIIQIGRAVFLIIENIIEQKNIKVGEKKYLRMIILHVGFVEIEAEN